MPVVDVVFPARGGPVPVDHGYALFSALSARLSWLHSRHEVGVFNLRGQTAGNVLALSPGFLSVRCPAELIPELLPLVNAPLRLLGASVTLGPPTLRVLQPAPAVSSRMATFKGALSLEQFKEAANRFLTELGCAGRVHVGRRRVVTIADRKVVGYALDVAELSPVDSVTLQERGLGGRRHMGCGLFLPLPAGRTPGTWEAWNEEARA